ncbi:MAG: hypothetical protein HYY63_04390 [Elusimicrobia bacterium]|nr:hypothetical protein [Elusimicrobiota bacterium]
MFHPAPVKKESAPAAKAVWHEHDLLANEKEVLGFYFSGHPLAKFKDEMSFYATCPLGHLQTNGDRRVRVTGIIENVRRLVSKQQKSPYARFKLEDLEGEIDCVVFPKTYASSLSQHIVLNKMVVVSGRLNHSQGEEESREELIVEEILPLEKARETLVKKIEIRLSTTGLEDLFIEEIKKLLAANPGKCSVQFLVTTPSHGQFELKTDRKVKLTEELLAQLKTLCGENAWRLVC